MKMLKRSNVKVFIHTMYFAKYKTMNLMLP